MTQKHRQTHPQSQVVCCLRRRTEIRVPYLTCRQMSSRSHSRRRYLVEVPNQRDRAIAVGVEVYLSHDCCMVIQLLTMMLIVVLMRCLSWSGRARDEALARRPNVDVDLANAERTLARPGIYGYRSRLGMCAESSGSQRYSDPCCADGSCCCTCPMILGKMDYLLRVL